MSSTLFKSTQRAAAHAGLDAAIKVFNGLTSPKLPILLDQIAAKAAAFSDPDGDGDAGKLFSLEQEAALTKMLGIDADRLGTVLRAAVYVFETAGFAGAKPATLADELVGAGMDADRATAFHDAWVAQGRGRHFRDALPNAWRTVGAGGQRLPASPAGGLRRPYAAARRVGRR
ncbi:hypothetical protein FNF27_08357 [Cafeteria roenbergensis]|uniref:Uncharacterized protein n=1 Tax=Cafeteria roenbergensis TaxID=33653 RepID=A0A5A8D1V5_CAFRO|nr:hypothetical protein FNF27_08357 [Cafeteria roenbergensis]